MNAPRKRLGRGLDALLSQPQAAAEPASATVTDRNMPVGQLQPGRYQPRQTLSNDSLAELAGSIREQGVLQPLVVRPIADAEAPVTHEIVAGERRWRAAQLAGLEAVPVVVRELDDQSALAVALIENLQREDLNPVEQALSLARLAEEFSLTHQQVADAVGRSRSAVSNLLRLLDLEPTVKDMLANGALSMGHARALLPLDHAGQRAVAKRAVDGGWSVRQVEKTVRRRLETATAEKSSRPVDLQTRWLREQIARELSGKAMLKPRPDGTYKLDVGFAEVDELRETLDRVQALLTQLSETAGPRVRNQSAS